MGFHAIVDALVEPANAWGQGPRMPGASVRGCHPRLFRWGTGFGGSAILPGMAFLGRETEADAARRDRFKRWAEARSTYALVAMALGVLSVVDVITMVLGVIFGVAAIVVAALGLRELKDHPELLGHKLCYAGAALGVLGIAGSAVLWLWLSRG